MERQQGKAKPDKDLIVKEKAATYTRDRKLARRSLTLRLFIIVLLHVVPSQYWQTYGITGIFSEKVNYPKEVRAVKFRLHLIISLGIR